MRKNLSVALCLAAMALLASCAKKNVEKDAQAFVDTYTQEYQRLALAVNEARPKAPRAGGFDDGGGRGRSGGGGGYGGNRRREPRW